MFVISVLKRPLFPSVPGLTTTKGLALAFQANDPHASTFTLAILRLHENDFLNSLQRKWWGTQNECQQEQETSMEKEKKIIWLCVIVSPGLIKNIRGKYCS